MNTPARTAPPRPEDEALGLMANLMYGFQHVLTMYGGIIAPPLISARPSGRAWACAESQSCMVVLSYGRRGNFEKSGGRFSRKAFFPSEPSSVM